MLKIKFAIPSRLVLPVLSILWLQISEQITVQSLPYICSQMEIVKNPAHLVTLEVLEIVENCWINQQANRIILLTEPQSIASQIRKLVMRQSHLSSIQLIASWPISPKWILILSSFHIHSLLVNHFLIEFSVNMYSIILCLLRVLCNISNYLSLLGKYCKYSSVNCLLLQWYKIYSSFRLIYFRYLFAFSTDIRQ